MTNVVFASVTVSTKTSSFSLNLSYKGKQKEVTTPVEGATQYTLALEGVKTLASLLKPEFNYDVTLNRKEFVGYFRKWNSKPTGVNKVLVGELFATLKEKGWEYDEVSSDDTSVVLYHTQTENLCILHPDSVEPAWETEEVSTEETVVETNEVVKEVATQEENEMKEVKSTQPAKKVGNLTSETAKMLAGDFKWLNLKPGKSFTASEWSVYSGLSEISNKLVNSKGMNLNKVRVLKRETMEVEKKELTSIFPKGVEGEVAVMLCGKDSSITLESSVINNRDIFIGSVDSFKFSKMSFPNTTHIVLFWNEEEVPVLEPALDFTKVVAQPSSFSPKEEEIDVANWENSVKKLTVKGVDRKTYTVYFENGMFCSSEGKIGDKLHEVLGTQEWEIRDEEKNPVFLNKEGKWEVVSTKKEEVEAGASEKESILDNGNLFTKEVLTQMYYELNQIETQGVLFEDKVSLTILAELEARKDILTFIPNTGVLDYGVCIGHEVDANTLKEYANAILANPTSKAVAILSSRLDSFEEFYATELEEIKDLMQYIEEHPEQGDSVFYKDPEEFALAKEALFDYKCRVNFLEEVLG